jgi:alpha-amylase
LWDLGEFNQNNTTRTKWGFWNELHNLSTVAQKHDMFLYFDAVLNHKAAPDEKFACRGFQVDWNGNYRSCITYWLDRNRDVGPEQDINPKIHFLFPGRENTYSAMKWNWDHFTGVEIVVIIIS